MKKETLVLVGLVAALTGGLCLVTGILVGVLVMRATPVPVPAPVAVAAPVPAPEPAPVPAPVAVPAPVPVPVPVPAPAPAPEEDWATHKDPMGFSVDLPRGWTVEPDHRSGRVRLAGPGAAAIHAWPLFVPGKLDAPSASSVLSKLAPKIAPDVTWGEVDAPKPGVARLRGRPRAGTWALALLTWTSVPDGAAAHVYVVLPGEATNDAVIARICASFHPSGAAGEDKLTFVKWQDPVESAFTIEVPKGWKVQGGLKRVAPTDIRGSVLMTSPEGDVRVTSGDVEIPPFAEPTQLGQSLGFTEGKWYAPGGTVNFMIRRYVKGLDAAKRYVTKTVARNMSALEIVKETDRADLVAIMNKTYDQSASPGQKTYLTAGEVAFKGKLGETRCVGSYFAGTTRSILAVAGIEPVKLWYVTLLYGYVAVEGKAALARTVLDRLTRSYEPNPEWVRMQQGITAASQKIAHETQEEISKTISDSYWKRASSDSELSRRRSNATLGVEDVIDATTGRETKVESGSNYYWLDPQGTIVGTDTPGAPAIEFRELIRRP